MGISIKNVSKSFGNDHAKVLTDISFEISDGDFVSLTGRSGSGKSTLLYIISSLDNPTEGSISISGRDLASLKHRELHEFRNQHIGFVFQFHYLLAELTAIENVLMPCAKTKQQEKRRPRAEQLLKQFSLENKFNRLPRQLSGGEQQRVAIARALIMEPEYLFADEPTGNLDSVNGEIVMKIFKEINQVKKTTIVFVTHEPDFAAYASRRIHLADGKLVQDERN